MIQDRLFRGVMNRIDPASKYNYHLLKRVKSVPVPAASGNAPVSVRNPLLLSVSGKKRRLPNGAYAHLNVS